MKIIRSINVEKEIWEQLQEIAKKRGRSASNMVEELVKEEKEKIKNENKESI